jgi:hypothetical protein
VKSQEEAPRAALLSALSAGVTGSNRGIVQRQKAAEPQTEAKPHAEEKVEEETVPHAPIEIWNRVEPVVIPELEMTYVELGRFAAIQTRDQVKDFFDPYDKELKTDKLFSDIMGIAAGFAGNYPSDTLSQYASLSGGIGGAIGQAVQVYLARALSTDKVDDAKERVNKEIDTFLAKELTRGSQIYKKFESQAMTEFQAKFDKWWQWWAKHMPSSEVSEVDIYLATNKARDMVREQYGADSPLAEQVLSDLKTAVDSQLKNLAKTLNELQGLKKKLHDRRLVAGTLAGGALGGLIGTFAGAAASKGDVKWGALGGAIGLVGGGLLGLAGGAIANA